VLKGVNLPKNYQHRLSGHYGKDIKDEFLQFSKCGLARHFPFVTDFSQAILVEFTKNIIKQNIPNIKFYYAKFESLKP